MIMNNPRRACAARLTVVGLSVSYRPDPTNDTTYLTGNEGQKICGIFSETAPFVSYCYNETNKGIIKV